MLPLITWAAWLGRGKAVYDSHELWVGMNPETSPLFNRIARWIETRYIRQVDVVVTVNEPIADELRRCYSITTPTVVMNCPEPIPPAEVKPAQSFRTQLGLTPGTPVVLYQGGYEPGRGLEALIDSGRYLSLGIIVLRGYGALEEELRRRIAEQPEPKRVFMVDPIPISDVVDAASEADIGVVPYTAYSPDHYYASPNKFFEYMLAGLAIACSDLPVLEKIVMDHDLGVVFDPSNPRQIAQQLNTLIGNPVRLRICRENARNVARTRYHWEHEGGKLVVLYQALVA
jgi:glycosyltransferase involved in cell wall biosynthesis